MELVPEKKVSNEIYQAFSLIKEKKLVEAEAFLKKEIDRSDPKSGPERAALLESTLGFLYRVKGDPKAAWRAYEKAEKLLPEDPSLKIISARFLIDEFAQYDSALKKAKQVLKLAAGSPSFEHQAKTTMGLAYLRKGEKKKARDVLQEILKKGFDGMASAENIDFNLVEAFLRRNLELDQCRQFIEKALTFARVKKEPKRTVFIEKLIGSFEQVFAHP
ncbi:MAG: hypothetical protein Q7S98_04110 [Deltaproteobacteria bacterium]|nr:hypothetical protein [Deltaproteobacteria bacterium]